MRRALVVVAAFALMVTTAVAAVCAVRALTSSTRYPRLRQLAQLLFPPGDLYGPLVEIPVNLAKEGVTIEFEYSHRYPGRHSLDLDVPVPVRTGMASPGVSALSVVAVCVDSTGRQVDARGNYMNPYWRNDGWGVSILVYDVPDQLALTGRIRCRVSCSGGAVFAREFPAHRLVVRKRSEE